MNLLYSTENSVQYSIMTYMWKESKKSGYIYIYVQLIHLAAQQKLLQHCKIKYDPSEGRQNENHNHRKLTKLITRVTALSTQWNYEPCCVGPKLVEVMEFQMSYFKSSKMMLWKCCTQYASKFGKLSGGHRTGKGPVFIPIPKKGNAKECSNYLTVSLISHVSKVMLKILQAKLQQYFNCELPGVQARFRKGRGTMDQIANIHWIIKKAREF